MCVCARYEACTCLMECTLRLSTKAVELGRGGGGSTDGKTSSVWPCKSGVTTQK